MPIADITIRTGRTLNAAVVASEALLADTFGRFGLPIHETGTVAIADFVARLGALCGALLAHEALLAPTHSGAFAGVLLASTTAVATTDTAQSVLRTAKTTVAAHEAFLAKTLPAIGAARHTLTLSRANAALRILGAGSFALSAEETLFALAEGDLLHLIVQADAIATADATSRGAWAARVAGPALPGTHTFALGLTELVEAAFSIFAAHLLAEALRALLGAVATNGAAFTLAASLLTLVIEKASTSARAADLATIDETWALHHTLGPSATASAGALGGVGRAFAAAEEGRQALHEGGVLAEFVEAGASTATCVGVVADVQVVAIVANEILWLIQRLESNVPLVGETRAHAVGRGREGGPRGLREVHPVAFVDKVVTLPVRRFERHALRVALKSPRAAASPGVAERAANLPDDVPLVVAARGCSHLGTVPHMPNVVSRLIKLKGAARGRREYRIFQLGVIVLRFLPLGELVVLTQRGLLHSGDLGAQIQQHVVIQLA